MQPQYQYPLILQLPVAVSGWGNERFTVGLKPALTVLATAAGLLILARIPRVARPMSSALNMRIRSGACEDHVNGVAGRDDRCLC